MIRVIFDILAGAAGLYSLIIFVRIMITWFTGGSYGRTGEVLASITDPYLNWFRRFPILRTGFLDLSPIAGMAFLSLAQNVFSAIAVYGRLSLGVILAIALSSLWSALSFLLGFFTVILALRLIAFLANLNTRHPFWQVIDGISQPILYKIVDILPPGRTGSYMRRLLIAIAFFLIILIGGGIVIRIVSDLLIRLPF
ncbi:MAG: YggT family protein [Treponema sp.]|jgi:YggT family protein|nr:YggT family protein [Treponema sp.]